MTLATFCLRSLHRRSDRPYSLASKSWFTGLPEKWNETLIAEISARGLGRTTRDTGLDRQNDSGGSKSEEGENRYAGEDTDGAATKLGIANLKRRLAPIAIWRTRPGFAPGWGRRVSLRKS
jgi:hypothetical protein